jgi:hypothetical protein
MECSKKACHCGKYALSKMKGKKAGKVVKDVFSLTCLFFSEFTGKGKYGVFTSNV